MKEYIISILLLLSATYIIWPQQKDTIYLIKRDTITLHHYYNPQARLLSDRNWYQRINVGPTFSLGYNPFNLKLMPDPFIGFGISYSFWP